MICQKKKNGQAQVEQTETVTEEVEAVSQPKRVEAPVKQPAAKKGGGVVAYLALLLSLLSIGAIAGAYWLYVQQQDKQLQERQLWQTQQTQTLSSLEQNLKQQLSTDQSAIQTQYDQNSLQLKAELAERLGAMESKVLEVSGRQPNDWVLAEAEYLIRIAGRKLWLEHDKETAKGILATADLRISSLNDGGLFSLRQAIAEDIAVIDALPDSRVTDYYLNLSGLVANVDQMKVNVLEPGFSVKQSQPLQTAQANSWWG